MLSNDQQQFLNDNRPHYETLVRADFLTNIGYEVKDGLLNIARVFDPGYQTNLWCSPCVCELVKYAYTQYDKWLLEQPRKVTLPKHDEPVIEVAELIEHIEPTGGLSDVVYIAPIEAIIAPVIASQRAGKTFKAKRNKKAKK